jgi:hypothetical protein
VAQGPAADHVVRKIVAAYQQCDDMAFCYGQGSVLTGLTQHSDVDVVMIWRDQVPARPARPVQPVSDPGVTPIQYDGSFGGLDNLQVGGWPVDVAHYTQEMFESWISEVLRGNGWQEPAWPLPLFAVSGFAYGVILADTTGAAQRARSRVDTFPPALLDKARLHLDQMWPGARGELEGCVRRSDGWLFHQLAVDVLRTVYITWFAAHHRYCPFLKRTSAWAQRFELDPELLQVERHIWRTAHLDERLGLIGALVEGVLSRAAKS